MLVQCTGCGISYEHSLRRCVACGASYVPGNEERLRLCAADAQKWLESGAKRSQVRARLIWEQRLSEEEADGVVAAARRELRRQARQHGRYVAGSGMVLLLVGAFIYVFTGGFVIASGCLAVGGAMLALGLLKAVTGWNITGHDDDPDPGEGDPLTAIAWRMDSGR